MFLGTMLVALGNLIFTGRLLVGKGILVIVMLLAINGVTFWDTTRNFGNGLVPQGVFFNRRDTIRAFETGAMDAIF